MVDSLHFMFLREESDSYVRNNAEVQDKDPIKDTSDTLRISFSHLFEETSKMQRGDAMMSLGTVHGFETYQPRLLVSWMDWCGCNKNRLVQDGHDFFCLEKGHLSELIRTHSQERSDRKFFQGAGELPPVLPS